MKGIRSLAVAAALVVVAASAPAAPSDLSEATGAHFHVVCHFKDDALAAAALETVEAIWPTASEFYGLPATPLAAPLQVNLYRRAADYLAVERAIAEGDFDKNLAFSGYATCAAYVALQPDLTDAALDVVGLTAQTRHLLAHEAAHLVRYTASRQFRRHPGWFSDGAAIWIEEQTTAARGWSAGDEDPYVAYDMVLAQRRLAAGSLPSVAKILKDDVPELDMYERYAVRKLLFRRLITRKDAAAFRAAASSAMKLGAGPDFDRRFFETMTAPYATEGLDGLDLDFEQYVRSRTPAWEQTARALSTSGDAWTQAAFGDHNAVAWRTAPVGADAYSVRGQFEILPGNAKMQVMSVFLGRDKDTGHVAVSFIAGYGVDVFLYDARDAKWLRIADGPSPFVQLARHTSFRIDVEGGKVRVALDGTDVVAADVKGHAMSGAWGLGVQAGGAGVWRGIKVETTKPR